MKKAFITIIIIIITVFLLVYFQRSTIKAWYYQKQQPTLPAGLGFDNFLSPPTLPSSTYNPQNSTSYNPDLLINQTATTAKSTGLTPITNTLAPDQINLIIPFTSQAPFANWNLPYQETCEEAATLMVHYYFTNKKFTGATQADDELLKIIAWENTAFGDYKDTTAEQTVNLIKKYFNYNNVTLLKNPTVEQIKTYLGQGLPVIVPTYGKALPNPNFRGDGPLYHMLVIKGYTPTTFITNDPGTKNGADFQYKYNDLMNAIHDWNNGDVATGQKIAIIIQPN